MVATSPWGDVFDEFTARNIPYGFNHQDSNKRGRSGKDLNQLRFPDEDGAMLGRSRVPVTTEMLTSRIERWNDYYNAKLRIIEVDLRDLSKRRQGFGYALMLGITAVFSFIVFLAVLAVDYAVLSEFWARVYSNEYGEVPPDFAASVVVKSLQVVVAALAFHFFFQNLSREHRKIFTFFVFGVTLLFLLGLGFLNAANSLPPGSDLAVTTGAQDASQEDQEILEALGLADETDDAGAEAPAAGTAGQQAAPEADRGAGFRNAYEASWFATLALLFIAVTSVAALVLHVALRAVAGLFGRIDNEHYFSNRSIMNRRDMRFRQLRARRAGDWLRSVSARKDLLRHCLSAFESGYLYGLFNENKGGLFGLGGQRRLPESAAVEGGEGRQTQEQALVMQLEQAIQAVKSGDAILGPDSTYTFIIEDVRDFTEIDDEGELRKHDKEAQKKERDKDKDDDD